MRVLVGVVTLVLAGCAFFSDAESCARDGLVADVDGDGRDDTVGVDDEQLDLVLCRATGESARLPEAGMGELLDARDLDGDGASEILFGGTTVSASVVEVASWEDGEFVAWVTEDGARLQLWQGGVRWDDDKERWAEFRDWDCADADGDGAPELVSASGLARGDGYDVHQRVLAVRGGVAVLIDERSEQVPVEAGGWPDLVSGDCAPQPAGS